jgi:hypothetical protein
MKLGPYPRCGINFIDLDRIFQSIGGQIRSFDGTGEKAYFHGIIGRPSGRGNVRRKDAPREFVRYTRRVMALLKAKRVA